MPTDRHNMTVSQIHAGIIAAEKQTQNKAIIFRPHEKG
jgi:hypothetical protein